MKVTAVVTTYNRFELAKRAIRSVISQTYNSLEIIVVEDSGDSGIEGWLAQFCDQNIKYIQHPTNRGLAAARNTAIKMAEGEYIAFLDDDDEWKPMRVEKQMDLIRALSREAREKCGVVSCCVETVINNGKYISVARAGNIGNMKEAIMENGMITPSSTFLFSKFALQEVNGFDEELPSSIDHDIWMSLATRGYDAWAVEEALVVDYGREGRNTMMSDTVYRIKGVRMFVEKWMPSFHEWFGDVAGLKYGKRYFARVIIHLSVSKILSGNFKDAWQALEAVFDFNDETSYNLKILFKQFLVRGAKRIIPYRFREFLKQYAWLSFLKGKTGLGAK
ncbi:hypothetical protein MNBD_GAMMA16-1165 [hydrothermal vent metagenome]|uniref:Glycosyltransferase 2-like domain-containing protein n=1 Tax=hydrothermal vent metagenome TaxID=652676 RepID=A0A3B0ZMJ0_9ZZZZ